MAFACAAASAAAQTKQTLTHELLWSFQRVGAPVPSPDGKWVVFTVTEPSYDPAKDVADLWIVPADGRAQPRRLTSNKAGESGPAWSADSARLAFAAKRDDDEVAQIYVLDVALGGDAQRVTNAPTAASAPKWSPDGTRIVFQAAMWSGATDEESNRKAAQEKRAAKSKVRVYDAFPIRNFDRWLDESKTHVWVVDVAATSARPERAPGSPAGDRKARSLLAGTKLAALEGFGGDALGAAGRRTGSRSCLRRRIIATWPRARRSRRRCGTCLSAGGEPTRLAGARAGTWARRGSALTAKRSASRAATTGSRSTRCRGSAAPRGPGAPAA